MTKNLYLFLISNFYFLFSFSQNLVPNPSFEIYDTCPDNENLVEYATGWSNYGGSPDYHNSCSSNPQFSVPDNWGGFQQAATGNAYCGISTYCYLNSSTSDSREFIGIQISTLEVGKKYNVSFKASLGVNEWPAPDWNCATNNLGILFSIVPFDINIPLDIKNFAHIYSDSIISDSMNWTLISGNFIADSAYQYMAIGNFFDDASTDTLKIFNQQFNIYYCCSYYYIDDIIVEKDTTIDTTAISESAFSQNISSIYPNPFSEKITIEFSFFQISEITVDLIDLFGKKIKSIQTNNTKKIEIFRDELPCGIYFLSVSSSSKVHYQKIIITD
jgi:OmpA-OmpF porin, OOP family